MSRANKSPIGPDIFVRCDEPGCEVETVGPLEKDVCQALIGLDSPTNDELANQLVLLAREMDKRAGPILGAPTVTEPDLLCEAADFIEEVAPDAVPLIQRLRSTASQAEWEADPHDPAEDDRSCATGPGDDPDEVTEARRGT